MRFLIPFQLKDIAQVSNAIDAMFFVTKQPEMKYLVTKQTSVFMCMLVTKSCIPTLVV